MELVHIPDFRQKARLLYGRASYVTGQGEPVTVHNQKDLAQAIGMNPADLSRAMNEEPPYLPPAKLPAFLRLFGLSDIPDKVQPKDEWVELATLTYELFYVAVKQRGGLVFLKSPWDQFVVMAQKKSDRIDADAGLSVISAPAAEWKKAAHQVVSLRMLANGQPDPVTDKSGDLPIIYAGDRAHIELFIGSLIPERPLYVMMFQDIVIEADSRQRFIPLLPSPPTEFHMPEPIIGPRDYADGLVVVPCGGTNGEPELFEVPEGWGRRRRVTAVISRKKIGADIYSPLDHGWEIPPDRLDDLANRLQRNVYGAWAVLVYDYMVQARPKP